MTTASRELPPIPPPVQRVIDPKTGLMDEYWYRWFKAMDDIIRVLRTEV